MAYKRKTNRRLQPYLYTDDSGHLRISEFSLRKGAFKSILRQYSIMVCEAIHQCRPHPDFKTFYYEGLALGLFPKNRAATLYINNMNNDTLSMREYGELTNKPLDKSKKD